MKKILIAILFSFVVACSSNVSSNTYQAAEVGVVSKTVKGKVIAKRPVSIDAHTNMGSLAGATAGMGLGAQTSGHAGSAIAAGVGGAVIGGLVGHGVDKAINNKKGFEYIIELKDGDTISVVQTEESNFAINQKVLVIYGAMTRVIADET